MRPRPSLTPRQRVSVLNCAIQHVENMHDSVTGDEHVVTVQTCPCEYGQTIRGLKFMRREAYAAVQKTKSEAK